ncbi:MAG: lysoplasmalogenase family protein [Promethearchaeota archaeon]
MINLKLSKRVLIPSVLGLIGLITVIISEIINQTQGSKIVFLVWLASIFVTISTLIIRFYSIDPKKFADIIISTNPIDNRQLKPQRFLNWILISMIVGLIATITIHYDFIIGVIVYLLMQFSLITAFSGIFLVGPRAPLSHPKFRRVFIISIVFWAILIPVLFIVFVWSDIESLIVIPYVATIGAMACISWFGLGYTQRSMIFRAMIVTASALFIFSDLLIGNARYGRFQLNINFFIDITYVINILLMSHAILFLRDDSNLSPLKD